MFKTYDDNYIKLDKNYGSKMYLWAKKIFPFNRSLTGLGVDQTLEFIKNNSNNLKIHKVKSGTKVFDWTVPYEWKIAEGYIENIKGKKIIDIKNNNLHVVGYSKKINKVISKKELIKNLYFIKKQPDAIPYVTSYYKKNWGFCLSYNQLKKMTDKHYKIKINSSFKKGFLKYGELYLKGASKKEILYSTYICHPSMANNEISGPVVTLMLYNLLKKRKNFYSYRFIFLPETIGSICFIKKNIKYLKKNLIAGFVNTCLGDNQNYSFLSSRYSNTYADKVGLFVLNKFIKKYKKFSYLDRGSDERQYCSPGVDLPVCSLMRTKYGEYKEYHTSKDDLNFISEKGLLGSLNLLFNVYLIIEKNLFCKVNQLCEPFMTNKNIGYPSISKAKTPVSIKNIMDVIAYSDGKNDTIDLSNLLNLDFNLINDIQIKLIKNKILKKIK